MSDHSSKSESSSQQPRIGELHAQQPLSGITRVDATSAVNGMGHSGFLIVEKTAAKKAQSAA